MNLPTTPSMRLDGKTAIIAGASSGIGLGAACALAEAGAHVVCVARRYEVLKEVVDAISKKGWSAEALQLDISDLKATEKALTIMPCFDIVVNSAGIARHTSALETTPQDYDAVMDINVRAAYFLSQICAKRMIEKGRKGSIVHISSQMGHVGGIDRAVYCASKWAIEGMVKAMAMEWGKSGVRINTICPTFVSTPLTQATLKDPQRAAWIMEKIKLGRLAEVDDIMGAVLYLSSDLSKMVTGTSLLVDGGWTAG